jgi:HD superfamily phosphodiesterase
MTASERARAEAWARRAPQVPDEWFFHYSWVHGASHTKRVHIHAQRLLERLGWSNADAELALCAALWHDIGRVGDGVEPGHGVASVARAGELGLSAGLAPAEAAVVRFAIVRHSLRDHGAGEDAARLAGSTDRARRLAEPERALRVLWLLKDADALDRVRLGERSDPRQLRHPQTIELIPFASHLYAVLP